MKLQRTVVLLGPAAILGLLATSIIGIDRLAFRDVSHFYTPLYDYVDWRMSQQWLPLWNPLDHTGMPLIGESSTAVLYPIRIFVYALPLSSEVALAWYIAVHLVIAVLTTYVAARWSSATVIAASVASIVYSMSGTVLFLYCNPPFLCGAAWLPLVVAALVSGPSIHPRRKTIIAAMAMSMMVLAGDPQTTLHALLLCWSIWIGRRLMRRSSPTPAWVLIATPLLAAVLAAPQLAASVSWSRHSDRVSIAAMGHWSDPPLVGSKRYQSFQYSFPPWHVVEVATPNAYGSLLPEHRRLSRRLPGDGRMWTPSIYMGVIVVMALMSQLSRWRKGGFDTWMTTAALGLWLSLGHFGLVWVVQTNTGALSDWDSAVGGAYWMLYQFVPGYDSFRYPAKWLVFVALGLAMITAMWIDRITESPASERGVVVVVGSLMSVSLLLAILVWGVPRLLIDLRITSPEDVFWGPLQVAEGFGEIAVSWFHSWVVSLAILAACWWMTRRKLTTSAFGIVLLLITLVDLSLAGTSLVHRVSSQRETAVLDHIELPPIEKDPSRWMRTQSGGGWPKVWSRTSSEQRLLEVEASGRAAWFGRWHLSDRVAVFNNMVSIRSRRIDLFWKAAADVTESLPADQSDSFWRSMRSWLSINNVLHVSDQSVPSPQFNDARSNNGPLQIIDRRFDVNAPAEALRVHWNWTERFGSMREVDDVAERLREIWNSEKYIPRIESNYASTDPPQQPDGESKVEVVAVDAETAEFIVELSQPALLTRATLQDGHWKAEYQSLDSDDAEWQPAIVHQVDGLLQGVLIPEGNWRLRFRYRPWWLTPTITLSVLAWIVLLVSSLRSSAPLRTLR